MSKKTLITFFIGLIIGSVSFSYAAWTAPTDTPPNGNVAAPINVSNLAQDKAGVLTTGGLGVFGSELITTTAGYTLPSNLNLGVNGYVGAKGYCDEKGKNCVTTLGGSSGGVSTSGGAPIICGGWDVKYGTSSPINGWGCGSSATCPSGYDTIKSSKVTINLAEQTNLCVLHSAGGGGSSGSSKKAAGIRAAGYKLAIPPSISDWPDQIVCQGEGGIAGLPTVLDLFLVGNSGYVSYSQQDGITIMFNTTNGDVSYVSREHPTCGASKGNIGTLCSEGRCIY
ncbi:MAG: hypothetical protein V4509_02140 [Patescibacteria group bacterium]